MCGELLAFVGRSHSGQKSWKKSNRKLALRLLALSFPLTRAGLLLSLNDQIYTEAAQVSLERPSGAVHRVETVRHLQLLMRERGNVLGGNPHSAWKGRTSQLFADIAG